MFSRRNRPTAITDAPEHRAIPIHRVELRAEANGQITLTGYASTFEPYEMYGGPAAGGWVEQIDKKAFTKTLRESPDLMLLINHEGMPLARTKSGTLKLSVDSHGLKVSAKLDRSDPDVQRLEAKMRRKDMDEMSFAFRVKAQIWSSTPEFPNDNQALRTITEVSLHKGDVSVVNYGANPTTSAELKGRKETQVKKTMTVAEALAICARDRWAARGTVLTTPAGSPMSVAEALAVAESASAASAYRMPAAVAELLATQGRSLASIEAQETREAQSLRAKRTAGDAVVARAKQLLESYRPPRPVALSVAPDLRAAVNSGTNAFPALGPLLAERKGRQAAARAKEMREAGINPLTGQPYHVTPWLRR